MWSFVIKHDSITTQYLLPQPEQSLLEGQLLPQESKPWSLSKLWSSTYRKEWSHWTYSCIDLIVPLVGEKSQVLFLHCCYQSLSELLLSSLKESWIIVEVSLHSLIGSNSVIQGQIKQDSLEVKILSWGSCQLALHVSISNVLKNLLQ